MKTILALLLLLAAASVSAEKNPPSPPATNQVENTNTSRVKEDTSDKTDAWTGATRKSKKKN